MSNVALQTQGLSVGYYVSRKPRTVLSDLNVDLHAGEFVCMLGPNGVGKSTMLRTLARMQPSIAGHVRITGGDIRRMNHMELARRLSVVLTERIDVGVLPGYDLVAMGRYPYTGWGGRLTPEDHRVVEWAIRVTGSEVLAQRNVAELSDGERQRVMIARALAQEPAVMLLDEPTAFLDAPRRAELTSLLRQLARETGRAILLSTHDVELALRTADTIWLITPQGRLMVGAPEDLVLNGTFERSFFSSDFTFDAIAGGFQVRHKHLRRASIRGDGLVGVWTRRALERAGFAIIESPDGDEEADLTVTCHGETSVPRWRATHNGDTYEYVTLADLIGWTRTIETEAAQPMV